MFLTLFLKECKELLKSITYYMFLLCTLLFYMTQLGSFEPVSEPVKEELAEEIPREEAAMESAIGRLMVEFSANSYSTYPYGFIKEVKLNGEEQKKVGQIIEKLTGYSPEEFIRIATDMDKSRQDVQVVRSISYEEFMKEMKNLDELLGGGSYYDEDSLLGNRDFPDTYEEARKEYERVLQKDQVTGAYGRIFCDYMGILMGILPVFLAVTRGVRDKRAKAAQVVFAKKASSFTIQASRYAANLIMILIPLLILSTMLNSQAMYLANVLSVKGNPWYMYLYLFCWLMPTVMTSLSVGFFITELTEGPLAILLQGGFWFYTILTEKTLTGYVGTSLVPRFNSIGYYSIYEKMKPALIANRLGYLLISLLLFVLTVFVYEKKRRGGLAYDRTLLSNTKNQSKA
ncbi:MAG: ABC transporter permease [Roseburia sp.]|nr:ABC transporter permease [Roseburia sp.]MCM1279965.1 ABC transporter permease [Robinsoniella sp.]